MTNIAFLTYGLPRFIGQQESYLTHKKLLLDKYEHKVLSHHWIPKPSNDTSGSIPSGAISLLTRLYNPARYFIELQKPIELPSEMLKSINSRYNPSIWSNLRLMEMFAELTSIQRVFSLLMDYMADTGEGFDFVILTQTDSVILDIPYLDDLDPYKFYIANQGDAFPDKLMIMGTKFIESWGTKLASSAEEVYNSMFLREPSARAFKSGCFHKFCQAQDLRYIHIPCSTVIKKNSIISIE